MSLSLRGPHPLQLPCQRSPSPFPTKVLFMGGWGILLPDLFAQLAAEAAQRGS